MKQNTIRILNSCGLAVAICGIGIYNTIHRGSSNSIDYQLKINYQAHPLASIIGSMIPGFIAGFAFYWLSRWRAKRKQKKLSSITPKEAVNLLTDNIDGQYDEALNGFLLKAAAKDIQEFILNINGQSEYVQRAKTALDFRIAENAEINNRRILYLTVALVVLTVALLAFPFLQMMTDKKHEVVKAVASDAKTRAVAGGSTGQLTPTPAIPAPATLDDLPAYFASLKQQMTPEQTAEAQRLSREFQPHTESAAENLNRAQFEDNKAKAEKGDAIAQYNLGVFYWKGQGVPQDYAEALKWSRKAAEQGYPAAQVFLADRLLRGYGVVIKKDEEEAAKWYLRAAKQNDADAQFSIGYCYYNGQGVPKNLVEAAKWFELSRAQGHITFGESILPFTPDQKEEGQRLASEFKPHMESAETNSSSP